jgi:hypothetical protein
MFVSDTAVTVDLAHSSVIRRQVHVMVSERLSIMIVDLRTASGRLQSGVCAQKIVRGVFDIRSLRRL